MFWLWLPDMNELLGTESSATVEPSDSQGCSAKRNEGAARRTNLKTICTPETGRSFGYDALSCPSNTQNCDGTTGGHGDGENVPYVGDANDGNNTGNGLTLKEELRMCLKEPLGTHSQLHHPEFSLCLH